MCSFWTTPSSKSSPHHCIRITVLDLHASHEYGTYKYSTADARSRKVPSSEKMLVTSRDEKELLRYVGKLRNHGLVQIIGDRRLWDERTHEACDLANFAAPGPNFAKSKTVWHKRRANAQVAVVLQVVILFPSAGDALVPMTPCTDAYDAMCCSYATSCSYTARCFYANLARVMIKNILVLRRERRARGHNHHLTEAVPPID